MQDFPFMTWVPETTVIGIPLWSLLLALAAAVTTYFAIMVVLHLLTRRARSWASRSGSATAHTAADVLAGTSRLLVLLVALLVGANFLDLPLRWETRLSQLWFVAVALQLGLWGMRAIGLGVGRYVQRHSSSGMTQVSASATLLSWGLRTLLWSVVALAILSNLGVNITAFIASLGVGGIAVALAVQNILGDLFASLAIAVDKPFEVGSSRPSATTACWRSGASSSSSACRTSPRPSRPRPSPAWCAGSSRRTLSCAWTACTSSRSARVLCNTKWSTSCRTRRSTCTWTCSSPSTWR
jgi:hypothetical protein